MRKTILYDSNTGNTKAMAEAIAEGARESGDEVYLSPAADADMEKALSCDILYLGCPAMGNEMVGDALTDFCDAVRTGFKGRKVAIFGSYGRGDGLWLRNWGSRLRAFGAVMVNGPMYTKSFLHPDDAKMKECIELGRSRFT